AAGPLRDRGKRADSTGMAPERIIVASVTRSSVAVARRGFALPRVGAVAVTIGVVASAVAAVGAIGAHSLSLAPLGKAIVRRHAVPDGISYAAAHSAGWPNVPVLAEVLFDAISKAGDRGFLAVQVTAVAVGLALLAADMRRRGADDASSAVVLLLV